VAASGGALLNGAVGVQERGVVSGLGVHVEEGEGRREGAWRGDGWLGATGNAPWPSGAGGAMPHAQGCPEG
jgi:hypothetical protein